MATARRRESGSEKEPRKKGTSDLIPRILVAVPAIVFAALIIWQGGWVFAVGVGALAVICVHELSVMFVRARADGQPLLAGSSSRRLVQITIR